MKRLFSPRDVILIEPEQGVALVSAVDSCGGIGDQKNDVLHADPATVGFYTARVPLLEIMAAGAKPTYATLAVCSGPKAAQPLIAGVKKALGQDLPLIVSTEKNMPTSMTGIGVTVTGFCKSAKLLLARSKRGDTVYCAGLPLVGPETLREGARLFDTDHLKALFSNRRVHAVIPVGSMGAAAEAELLARESGLACRFKPGCGIDLKKSAGPSTCAVFSAEGGADFDIGLPITEIGELY